MNRARWLRLPCPFVWICRRHQGRAMAKDKWFYNEQKRAVANHLAQPNGTLYARYQGQMSDMLAEILDKGCPRSQPWNRENGTRLIQELVKDPRFQVIFEGITCATIRWDGPGEPADYQWKNPTEGRPPAAPRLDKIEARLDDQETWWKALEDRLAIVEKHLKDLGL